MEAYSHSHTRSHSRTQSSSSSVRKPPLFHANASFFTTSYDDVYAAPPPRCAPNLAPRAEDYAEIFGGFRSSRASSIPILDLPAVVDIDSASVFDYSDVFGGFHGVDFAVPFDQLFQPFDAAADGCSSDEEAWTPIGTESLSDDSDPFASSEKSQCFSNEDSHQALDNKHFNVSYHKVTSGPSVCMPNMTRVAQINTVHEYTCVVDGTTSWKERGIQKVRSDTADDVVFSLDSSSMSQKHERRMSENSLHTGSKSFNNDTMCGRAYGSVDSMSHVNSTSASVSNMNLRKESLHVPPPSRPPHLVTDRKGDINRLNNVHMAPEQTVDSRLPPCFDMDVNASSSAAASAAAMKDAMEKAQAKLSAAKVLMDEEDDFQESAKLNLTTDVNGREHVTLEFECASGHDRVQSATERVSTKHSFGKNRCVPATSQSLADNIAVEQPNIISGKPAERKHGKNNSLSMTTASTEGDSEWKEATQHVDFVPSDNARLALQPPSHAVGKLAGCKQQKDDEDNSDSAGEVCVPEGNRRRLKTTKSVSRRDYYERMIKVAQEVHDRSTCGHVETDQRQRGVLQGSHGEHKPCAEEEKFKEASRLETAETRSKNAFEKEETQNEDTEACQRWNDGRINGPQQSRIEEYERMGEERKTKELIERLENEGRLEEIVASKENKIANKVQKQRRKDKLADPVMHKKEQARRGIDSRNSEELFVDGFGGEGLKAAHGSEEKGKAKELKKMRDKKSKEALMDVCGGEKLHGSGENQENGKRKDLLQREECGNYIEVPVDCQGSVPIVENSAASRDWCQRLNEDSQFVAGDEKSEQGLKSDVSEGKFERVIERKIKKKSMQAGEVEEAVKISRETGNVKNQKIESQSPSKDGWEGEDQRFDSSPMIELPLENGHLKLSDGTKIEKNTKAGSVSLTSKSIKLPTEANGTLDVYAGKKKVEGSDVVSDNCKLETVETTDGPSDNGLTESIDAQMSAVDDELEKMFHVLDSVDDNGNKSKSGMIYDRTEPKLKDESKKVAQSVADTKSVKDLNLERGERSIDEGHATSDQEVKVKSTAVEGNNGWSEHARKKEPGFFTDMPERKDNVHKRSQLPNIRHNTEWRGKIIDQSCSSQDEFKERERTLEEERLRKLEEEREREREREKDRMAVEIAIREARERAHADAHELAERSAFERATDDARQKAMAEARERLEKACAEARERSQADKASEARLRAERAAVERATAEARQRAFDKAMAERATLEARERMQRSVSEKFSSERDYMRQRSMPSMHSEKSEATDSEPAQRSKARLERHRRTVERVANALAEKNKRDLLAQREQAERSRLAEALDADIKRWSNGKEGNLRALLSTLQYILGPDSGWQPIPLTEVITAAAVKKAYRKATLCVHPDKLQQRGASIQHKYICEKVFDLLKEAWNRFNSEEK